MIKSLQKKKQEGLGLSQSKGFTIIEVLIVLAIAGLIVLIVFLAVPALQRNSRNTQRKADVGALLGGLNEYINNSQGALPPNFAAYSGLAKINFYTTSDVDSNTTLTTALATPPGANTSFVYIRNFTKCSGNAIATTGATKRNIVAYYWVESSGAPIPQCQDT